VRDEQLRRYARHIVLPEIGEHGQKKILHSRVAVVGCGGLGSVAAGYLAAMGVGHLRLIDADRVELSNLQRQMLFETADIGTAKVAAACARIEEINSDIQVETSLERLESGNAGVLVSGMDVVVDATDNFASRIALHAACLKARVPLVYGAISGFEAQLTTWKGYEADAPCLHCYMPELPEREIACAQEGIVGALAGVIGSMQALEAVKELLGIGSLSGRLLQYNALTGKWRESRLARDASCKAH
jgi:molybdopterin-synthase adenylyltransferase